MTFDIERLRQHIPQGDGYNSDFAHDLVAAAEEIERLRLAEEGAQLAYATLIEEKHELTKECERLRKLLQSAHEQIRSLSHTD